MSSSPRWWRWRNSTAQLTLLYLALLLASVSGFFAFSFWSTTDMLQRQSDATIETEVAGLLDRFRTGGLPGLTVFVTTRAGRSESGRSLYLLTDQRFTPMAGNLPAWPPAIEPDAVSGGQWHAFAVDREDGTTHVARGRAFSLQRDFKLRAGSDFFLLVGRDVQDLADIRTQMLWMFGWTLGGTLLLGALGTWWVSRRFSRRIEQVNQASREVMAGRLSTRIPESGMSDDLDELVDHWNAMLHQIEMLMDSVRQVSDNIAHDLRTPLARLRNELEAASRAADDAGSPAEQRRHLERSIEEADALLRTFSALLRIARIEAGERRAGFGPVDLSVVVRDVVELYEPLAEARNQVLRCRVEGTPKVLGDRDLLFQAIANLVDNGVKYSPVGGEIAIEISTPADHPKRPIRVSVSDSGPGIAADNRPRVTERFYRVEASRSTPGNGLGLALVAAVAKLHRSEVVFSDADPGLRVTLDLDPLEAS